MRSLLSVISLVLLVLTASQRQVVAAEIYTFGRGADGSRYVKHVDRPVAERKAREEDKQASPGQSAGRQDSVGKHRGAAAPRGTPPPPLDPKALEVLNSPIM